MTLQINMNPGSSANGGVGVGVMTSAGNPWTVADALAQTLVNQGRASPLNWPAEVPGLTSAEILAFRTSVQGAVNSVQALAGTSLGDAVGAVRVLSDSANAGTRLRWFTPSGFSAPVWCWDIYPQSQYQG